MTPTVLVVEDDPLIASSLSRALRSRGYDAPVVGTVATAVESLASAPPDLVLLDLGLPDGDGSEVCDFVLHKLPHVPVIVLTARSDEIDVVLGLEMGAVDYVAKPFRLAELVARIQSHLRFAAGQRGPADGSLVIDDLVVDRARRRVHLGAEEVSLRPKEFDVLERLAIDAGRVVTREQLIDEVWDENWWGSTKTLDVHINSLRRKLGERPGEPSRITTIRGVGYRLDPADPAVRRRVLVTIVAVTVLAVAAFFVPAALSIRSRIQRGDLLELQREASIVASRIPASGRVDATVLGDTIGTGHEVAFYDGSGDLLDGQGPATDEFVATALRGQFAEGYEHGDLVAAVPLRPGRVGPSLVVRIEEPGERSGARIGRSIALLAAAALGVLLVAALIGLLLARRLSRPVEDLRQWATTLGQQDRPPPAAGIVELDELAAAMSASSERVGQLLQRERSFSSHVSHQLRTPVAAMRVAVETELDAPRPDPTEVLHECLRELDRLERTVTSMLALARHDERQPEWSDVAALVRAQAERWRAPYGAAGRTIDCRGASVWASVDAAAISHVVDVLLDNALIHGRGTVTVTTESAAHAVRIDVGDEGTPPVDADPFSDRRIETRHGIGLRLARTLAESQGGELGLVEGPTTMFRLMLPDAGPAVSPSAHLTFTRR